MQRPNENRNQGPTSPRKQDLGETRPCIPTANAEESPSSGATTDDKPNNAIVSGSTNPEVDDPEDIASKESFPASDPPARY